MTMELIDKNEAIKVLQDTPCGSAGIKARMVGRIEKMPSVTQKSDNKYRKEAKRWKNKWLKLQKSGKWIYDETLENWRCSKCDETPKTMGYVGTADFMAEHFKFCNHCGAKMESEEKE